MVIEKGAGARNVPLPDLCTHYGYIRPSKGTRIQTEVRDVGESVVGSCGKVEYVQCKSSCFVKHDKEVLGVSVRWGGVCCKHVFWTPTKFGAFP